MELRHFRASQLGVDGWELAVWLFVAFTALGLILTLARNA